MMNFPINLPVGASQIVNSYGNYFYYGQGSAGGADASIRVKTDAGNGDEFILLPGQGFRLDDPKVFTRLIISNEGGVAPILGKSVIAGAEFFDNRVAGSVEVIDGGKNRTLAGVAFIGVAYPGVVGGALPLAQLWNPVGSGKNVIVSRYACASSFVGSLSAMINTVPAATFERAGVCKKAGGAASVAQMRSEPVTGSFAGTPKTFEVIAIQAGTPMQVKFDEPIILPPGYGIGLCQNMAGADFQFAPEWSEEAVQ